MNRVLFAVADFLSRPPGFYVVLIAMVICTVIVPLGLTDVVTYALSVLAIVITGVVLIQGYRRYCGHPCQIGRNRNRPTRDKKRRRRSRTCRTRGDQGSCRNAGAGSRRVS